MFATAINQETLVWCGPMSPADIQEHFLSIFQAQTMVDGDVFAGSDSDVNTQRHIQEMCCRRGVWPPAGQRMHVRSLLPVGAQARYDKYCEAMQANAARADQAAVPQKADSPADGSAADQAVKVAAHQAAVPLKQDGFVCDLSQNPDRRFRAGSWMPTVARSSVMCSLTAEGATLGGHLFTPAEINFAHGWPSLQIPGVHAGSQVSLEASSLRLSAHQQSQLVGNSMHLVPLAAWLMYVMANTCRRETQMPPAISVAPAELETVVELNDTGELDAGSELGEG